MKVSKEFALLPPIVLDRISTDWAPGPGNNLLTHYTSSAHRMTNILIRPVPSSRVSKAFPTMASRHFSRSLQRIT